mgnify:CR=1 FL=1
MKGMKIGQILMMCCLVMSSAVMMYTNTAGELDEGEAPSHHTHGSDWTTAGEIEVVIMTENQDFGAIAWNPSTQVYDLAYTSERLRVEVQATGLESNRNFFIAWQLFGYVDGDDSFGPLRHMDPQDSQNDLLSGRYGPINLTTGETEHNTGVLRGYSDGIPMNTPPTNLSGCYWVMATIYVQSGNPALPHDIEIMQSHVSKRVSYGPDDECPTDDQDGDGWTDSQEDVFGSDPSSAESTPHSVFVDWQIQYYMLLEQFNALSEMYNSTLADYDDLSNDYENLREDYDNLSAAYNASLITAANNLNDTDEDGVIDIWEDEGCTNTSSSSYVNSTGCAYEETDNPAGPSCPECSAGVDITGNGDVADLTVIGGGGLLAGIGVSSILGQAGRGPNVSGGGKKKPDIDLDDVADVFDNLDLDALAEVAASHNRWEFLLTAAPLPTRGTGSPINPIATF